MATRVELIEGSSIDDAVVAKVTKAALGYDWMRYTRMIMLSPNWRPTPRS
jgi:hypothetical protein